MPLFEYECRDCGHHFEFLTRADQSPACPTCASADLQKLLSGFAVNSQIHICLFATAGGIVADRGNRHRIIVATQTISMLLPLVLAALTFSGLVRVWHVFVLAAGLGIVNAFDIPARQSFFFEMVGREDLMNAIALNSS